jgi:acyl transferase domain-containing protein/acyl carrier protein
MTGEKEEQVTTGLEIAVIGMSARFPGARDVDEFWHNLTLGRESISFFSAEELVGSGIQSQLIEKPNYVKVKGVLEDIGYFDHFFFGYTPKEAESLDPQVYIFHECAWEALENAGYDPGAYAGSIGLYAGALDNVYWQGKALLAGANGGDYFTASILSNKDYLCTLISYRLNLKGPGYTLQTACSTSLAAVHLACQGLISGECDMALAGGISISLPQKSGYFYQEGMIRSPDGHCRAFDEKAEGTVFGDGAGIVLLKPLEDAIHDRDNIYAVVKGTATNNDGSRKAGYTAPSTKGQAEVIKMALDAAEVEPESIGCIEAHGTGTAIGDPIEIEALKLAFNTGKREFCRIGSVKTNVGHLDAASGITGFIKSVLSLKHKQIPPSLNFESANPGIDFKKSPFILNTQLTQWENHQYPLRAGVSSFGIGGTNAHVVLEEPPAVKHRGQDAETREYQLIVLSAKTKTALEKMTGNLSQYLGKNPDINIADAAYTLCVGRRAFEHRRIMISSNIEEIREILSSPDSDQCYTSFAKEEDRPVVFMFPGQGAQYTNMGLELYEKEAVFRGEMDRCFAILNSLMDHDIKEILYPFSRSNRSHTSCKSYKSHIDQTEITQPLLFAFEYALAKLFMKWGISPHAMIGHSIGEYVAACLSGVFSLEDALKLVVLRGRLMQKMPAGSMAGVSLCQEELSPLLGEELSLAAVNGPDNCTVSGPTEAIEAFTEGVTALGIKVKRLHTSHAFHSRMMEPVLETFENRARRITMREPNIPFISNITGNWISKQEANAPSYWARHLREPVRFADGVHQLSKIKKSIFVEVGPGRALSTLVKQQLGKENGPLTLNLVRHPKEVVPDHYYLLSKVGKLWLAGKKIHWQGYYGMEERSRISLPTYPFEKKPIKVNGDPFKAGDHMLWQTPLLTGRKDIENWFYVPSWKSRVLPVVEEDFTVYCYLLFIDDLGLGTGLVAQMEKYGHDVIMVKKGSCFARENVCRYTINPGKPDDYQALMEDLRNQERLPKAIVHMWSVTEADNTNESVESRLGNVEDVQTRGYYSLLYLAQAIGTSCFNHKFKLVVLSNGMQSVLGEVAASFVKSTVLGPVRVIPREYPNIKCLSVDISLPPRNTVEEERMLEQLYADIYTDTPDEIIAYRNNIRWALGFEPVPWQKSRSLPRLKRGGVYMITGGLGGMGLVLAGFLARRVQAKLILVGRSQLPSREEWGNYLEDSDAENIKTGKIRKLLELEQMGAQLMVVSADVSDPGPMRDVILRARQQFGSLNGVVHCAGSPDGVIIQRRKREISQEIFAAKVKGTLVLDTILQDMNPDFFVVSSSIYSILGPVGQVGYCAANSFLDAFAHFRNKTRDTLTVSINWDGWREAGMAVNGLKNKEYPGKASPTTAKQLTHPLWDEYSNGEPGQVLFETTFGVNRHWVLDEHRVMGNAVLVGTAYLEMALAAFVSETGSENVEIRDVCFLNPLVGGKDLELAFRLVMKKRGRGFEFFFMSRPKNSTGKWRGHARGEIIAFDDDPPAAKDIAVLREKCREREITVSPGEFKPFEGFVGFSNRWNCLRRVHLGKDQGVAQLELLDKYKEIDNGYLLHPALLDVSTAFLVNFIRNSDQDYLPFTYKNVRVMGRLPRKVFGWVRHIPAETDSSGKTLNFDITIMDEQGNVLMEIEKYTLLIVSDEGNQLANKIRDSYPLDSFLAQGNSAGLAAAPPEPLKLGLSSAEGIDVFSRILGGELAQVVVSTHDLDNRIQRVKKPTTKDVSPPIEPQTGPGEESFHREMDVDYAAPTGEIQQATAEVIGDYLGITRIGIHDDLFELGLDSLKAINILSKIKERFNVDVPLAEIFNYPTTAGLAKYIAAVRKSKIETVEPVEQKEYYPLSSAQKRIYILQRMDLASIGYNISKALVVEGKPDISRMESAFARLIRRHETLRTSFRVVDEEPVQQVHEDVAFKVEYYKTTDDSQVVPEVNKFSTRAFELSRASLFRVGFIDLGNEKNILMFDIHHIISDGTSMGILVKEFIQFYSGEQLPPLQIQYKDFSTWQRKRESSKKIKQQEDYWLNMYSDKIPVLNLHTDYPRPQRLCFEGDVYRFKLEREYTLSCKKLGIEHGATLFMNLYTIFNILLHKYTGQDDIVVGCGILGRSQPEVQGIVGMFVNTLPIRNRLSPGMTYLEFLERIKQSTLNAFENQDIQFENLVAKLNPERTPSRNPLFDVGMIVQNFEQTGKKIAGISFYPYEYEHNVSKIDLSLYVYERENEIDFELEYSTNLFKASTVETFMSRFKEIIIQVLEKKNIKLKEIKLSQDILEPKSNTPDIAFGF